MSATTKRKTAVQALAAGAGPAALAWAVGGSAQAQTAAQTAAPPAADAQEKRIEELEDEVRALAAEVRALRAEQSRTGQAPHVAQSPPPSAPSTAEPRAEQNAPHEYAERSPEPVKPVP